MVGKLVILEQKGLIKKIIKMKNEKIWESYSDYTEKTSNILRWLSSIFFGFGYLQELYFLLIMLMALFVIDFLQYSIPSIIYRIFIRKKEKEFSKEYKSIYKDDKGDDHDYKVPTSLDRVAFVCWCGKIIIFLFVFVFILCSDPFDTVNRLKDMFPTGRSAETG